MLRLFFSMGQNYKTSEWLQKNHCEGRRRAVKFCSVFLVQDSRHFMDREASNFWGTPMTCSQCLVHIFGKTNKNHDQARHPLVRILSSKARCFCGSVAKLPGSSLVSGKPVGRALGGWIFWKGVIFEKKGCNVNPG